MRIGDMKVMISANENCSKEIVSELVFVDT
jgi:hypothetical protein